MRFLALSGLGFLLGAQPVEGQSRPDAAGGARAAFASAVAVSGSEVLVGRAGSPFTPAGAVHVFGPDGAGVWRETGSFAAAGVKPADRFGAALAVRGDLLAVGAPGTNGQGVVHLFERRNGRWTEVATLAAPDPRPGDNFGQALALDDGLILVGATGRDSAAGAVFAFQRDGARWSSGLAIGAGAGAGDRFGHAIGLAGGRALIGAPGPGPGIGGGRPRSGSVAVYRLDGGAWRHEAALTAPPADSALGFGAAVSVSVAEVLVGAPLGLRATGAVYRFRGGAAGWDGGTRILPAQPAPQSQFGAAIVRDGDITLVGAPGGGPANAGVHVLDAGGQERQRVAVDARGTQFGRTLAVAGGVAVVGGPGADFGEGTAWIYRRGAGGEWTLVNPLMDAPVSLPAVTGGEVRCDSTSNLAAGFGCSEVDLLAYVPLGSLLGKRGIQLNDIWGWTDPATRREYALVGRMDGTTFVDVTDPTRPVILGDLPLTPGARPNIWRDIKVYKDHAFIVADGAGQHGMQVFDLTQLRGAANVPVTFTADTVYGRIASAHNIAINEETGFAYTIGNSGGGETCGGALHMVDIRDPKRPAFAGCFADRSTGIQRTGYTHDNMCVAYRGPDAKYRGREICFNASETAVGIADVTDKANPVSIAVASYPNTSYAHQGWLSEDQRYYFLDDEGDEISGKVDKTRTLIWDLSNLAEPVLVTEYLGTTAASDHNLYVRGRYMYQANYVSGLRVVDISDPRNPREVGYFDTVPYGENTPGFDGAWSNYPYFPSGTIVVSSQGEGLFVLRHRPRPLVP